MTRIVKRLRRERRKSIQDYISGSTFVRQPLCAALALQRGSGEARVSVGAFPASIAQHQRKIHERPLSQTLVNQFHQTRRIRRRDPLAMKAFMVSKLSAVDLIFLLLYKCFKMLVIIMLFTDICGSFAAAICMLCSQHSQHLQEIQARESSL
jgi:hypothetical protein